MRNEPAVAEILDPKAVVIKRSKGWPTDQIRAQIGPGPYHLEVGQSY